MNDKAFMDKKNKLQEEAEKLTKEQKLVSAEAEIESKKDKLEEATDHYEEALADDPGVVSAPLESAEVTRTRTLMEQAEKELEEAKQALKDLKEGKDPNQEFESKVENMPAKVGK